MTFLIGSQRFDTADFSLQPKTLAENSLVLLALSTVLAGYLEQDQIVLNTPRVKNCQALISYLLNPPRHAPREFMPQIDFLKTTPSRRKTTPPKKEPLNNHSYFSLTGLLFSGGLDSTSALLALMDKNISPLPVWINFGQPDAGVQEKCLNRICRNLKLKPLKAAVNLSSWFTKYQHKWGDHMPARNFLLASIGLALLNQETKSKRLPVRLFLAAHQDEIRFSNVDKSSYFFWQFSQIASLHHSKRISLQPALPGFSKVEVLSYWRRNWEKKYQISALTDTTSCFSGNECGKCTACLEKAWSLLAAGYNIRDINLTGLLDQTTKFYTYTLNNLLNLDWKTRTEILLAMERIADRLPPKTARYFREAFVYAQSDLNYCQKEIANTKIRI